MTTDPAGTHRERLADPVVLPGKKYVIGHRLSQQVTLKMLAFNVSKAYTSQ
jgi:hypothetical protein